eukprot:TRINITY_DN20580_c0_g1_i1.p1 TRINITY_DN20580_c0_g1~~TRINITY_DN20580_c0_g1_i1.p1  ORF type:complete len:832 (-),score=99.36 TRINITY_DN20580_c0_g1_i1:74-2533(-)
MVVCRLAQWTAARALPPTGSVNAILASVGGDLSRLSELLLKLSGDLSADLLVQATTHVPRKSWETAVAATAPVDASNADFQTPCDGATFPDAVTRAESTSTRKASLSKGLCVSGAACPRVNFAQIPLHSSECVGPVLSSEGCVEPERVRARQSVVLSSEGCVEPERGRARHSVGSMDHSVASTTGRRMTEMTEESCIRLSLPSNSPPASSSTLRQPEGAHRHSASYLKPFTSWRPKDLTSGEMLRAKRMSVGLNQVLSDMDVSLNRYTISTTALQVNAESVHGLSPHTLGCFLWDMLGGILIIMDVVMVPVRLFILDQNSTPKAFGVIELIVAIYWSIDFLLRFFMGYETYTGIETRVHMTARHYLFTWCAPDILSVALDWFYIIQGGQGGASRSWHIVRLGRTVRTVPRTFKCVKLARTLIDRRQSERALSLTKALVLFLCVGCLAHYVGCGWCYIGYTCYVSGTGASWIRAKGLHLADPGALYLSAMSWSMAQSGFAAVDTYPTCVLEEAYTVINSFIWMMVLPGLISWFTIWMMHIDSTDKAHSTEMTNMRRFLKEHGISSQLTSNIVSFLRKNGNTNERKIHETDVPALQRLPESLRFHLHKQIYLDVLNWHPMFERFTEICKLGAGAITHFALVGRRYDTGQEVFHEGEEASEMIFVTAGVLKYFPRGKLSSSILEPGSWIGEPAVWRRKWIRCGHLVAAETSEVLALDGEKLRALMEHGEKLGWPVEPLRRYASNAAKYFQRSRDRVSLSSASAPANASEADFVGEPGADLWDLEECKEAATEAFQKWTVEGTRRHIFRASRVQRSSSSYSSS